MRVLQQVPGSVLWLAQDNATVTTNLRSQAADQGIAPERLIFSSRAPLPEHYARNALADLFLDTFPYGAHSTGADALWSGLPVLTRRGESFASRVAGSLLFELGLPELVTYSLEQYEATALHLATHPQELAALRRRLETNRATSPLFDASDIARRMERAYVAALKRHLSGQAPDHLDIVR
jgi:predicted O-linked N-acetylglucosamine transferase (SPINDLY family)